MADVLWVVYLYYTAIVLAVILVGLTAMGALGVDLDMDGHPDVGHDHHGDHGGLLSLLGVGKAPIAILVMSYLLCFGAAGVLFVMVGEHLIDNVEFYSLVFAIVFSVVSTSVFARIVGRFIPTVETYTKKSSDLVGREATVITRITPTSGSADVRDASGSLHRIPAKTESGEITRGEKVLVVNFDEEKSTFVVEQLPS
jgi:membrane protein implicated in regulation of membrane protease activity